MTKDKMDKGWISRMKTFWKFRKEVAEWKHPDVDHCIFTIIERYFLDPNWHDVWKNAIWSNFNIDFPEAKRWWWVYFIYSKATNTVKIWYTKNVCLRMIELQVWNPDQLELLLFAEWLTPYMESCLHKHFSKYHHRWEWFEYSDEIKEMVLSAKNILDGK